MEKSYVNLRRAMVSFVTVFKSTVKQVAKLYIMSVYPMA